MNTVPLGARGPWDFTRQRYQPTTQATAPLQPPGISVASTGVPSVAAASMGPASSHAMAYPAMAPMTPLGAFQPQQPVGLINPLGQPLPTADEFKTQKSPLPKLQMKGGDATVVTRTINEWLQKTALALNTWSSSAVQHWHQAVTSARAAHQQWTMLTPAQRAQNISLPSTGHALPLQMSVRLSSANLVCQRRSNLSQIRKRCYSDRSALPYVPNVFALRASCEGRWAHLN